MELRDVILKRRMVRHFTDEPVAPEAVQRVLELARHAPSAGFTQGQSFIVVTHQELKQQVAQLCGEQEYLAHGFHAFLSEAPVLIIPCTSEAAYHRRYQEADKVNEDGSEIAWPVPFWYLDIGCSVMLLLLAVVDEGLAAGFVGVPHQENLGQLQTLLHLPAEVMPVGVIPLGHRAADIPSPSLRRGRKLDQEYVHYERW